MSGPRQGREASTEALLSAARELFAERGPSAVSLRDVARRAGVSHGLIHHYIGSRDDLLRMVFSQSTERAQTVLDGATNPLDALQRLFEMGRDSEDYSRLLAWSLLEGRDPAQFHGQSPALDAVIAKDPAQSRELRLAVAAAMVQLLGVQLFGDYALTAAGLQAADRDALRAQISRTSEALVAAADAEEAAR